MEKIINYLGIDWGEKRIGLATADSEVNLALPFKTVATLAEVLNVIKEEEIDIVVLGDPQKMSGAEASNPLWLNFYDQLKARSGRRVELFDERLSSLAADALEGTISEKAERDEVAASIILQDYLDRN
ncbi:MAG: Holliday junction resolvase RuvX [Patescibacteria group bacterium]|jgi:putative Holliday junction resolvase